MTESNVRRLAAAAASRQREVNEIGKDESNDRPDFRPSSPESFNQPLTLQVISVHPPPYPVETTHDRTVSIPAPKRYIKRPVIASAL